MIKFDYGVSDLLRLNQDLHKVFIFIIETGKRING
jgi:hypothetical protein